MAPLDLTGRMLHEAFVELEEVFWEVANHPDSFHEDRVDISMEYPYV